LRTETSFYLFSHCYKAKAAGQMIRKHWHCENRNHHVRDVSLSEDASRIRTAPGVFARLRSFALNILRFNKIENVRAALFENALDFDGLISMKGLAS
jgi:predicted transposase YbfD/YdcC